jgi:hypothetical protein
MILEEEVFYDIFAYMFKKREILDKTLRTWNFFGGNPCKLVVISKIWSRF